ncbi:hypothetical protein I302_102687 [Kwoniella bestiolae CBS 10118]|uniref:Major facilitator superfamily (MFS) profile domain-containing protein n=1 Tax=Kwoniella bestiolae CBS 10118 TaxID=1296100 RepID=A0A1B9GFS9_9TREE|nr:hypothetical protein I302_01380 [Kwoniella bestiolae CBS 10118]OCF29867.1 hypothetical protein I302_01380 [Kwoniella bestiolae CBS 10118]
MTTVQSTHSTELAEFPIDAKGEILQIEELNASGPGAEELDFIANFDEVKKRKMYRKIDIRLVPMLAALYLFSYIDRANIGNAKIEGMTTDLKMSGTQYNIALSVFFVPYVFFEMPANAILHRYFGNRPSWWIGGLTLCWGTIMALHGAVHSFGALLAVRLALGIPEAGFFPAAVLICSNWYPRHMLQVRIALFYSASALAGAFSGLLAFAIAKMDGVGGIEGWRYIFILEGCATVALGFLVPFVLLDTVSTSKFLDSDEKKYLTLVQKAQDASATGDKDVHTGIDWKTVRSVVTDWQLYVQAIIYWSNTVPNYALKFTLPTIIKAMGFTSSNAQLLTIPPYILGCMSAFGSALLSDRFKRRMPFIVGAQTLVVIAFCIMAPLAPRIKANIGPCYFAICLACLGFYPINPGGNAWTANNLAGPAKRAMGMAYMICIGNIGGLIGSYIYIEKEAPSYPTGYGCSIAFPLAGIIAAVSLEFALIRINKKRSRLSEEEVRAKYTPQELADMGDRSPLYRYTL